MTKWLLAPGILAASAVNTHAAVGVALPLPVFLIVFAIFIFSWCSYWPSGE